MTKKVISAFLVFVMLLSVMTTYVFAEDLKISFSDVDATTEEGAAIYKLAENGIVSGNGDGTFTPERFVTRAELCKMVNNIWNLTEQADEGFKDVTADKWYFSHVLIGKKAGYINGFEDGTFRGESFVTREQACAIVCRISGLISIPFQVTISDTVSDWARDDVRKILENGLMVVEEGNKFRATENMKRGELAQVLSYFVSDAPATDNPPTTDQPNTDKPITNKPNTDKPNSDDTGNNSKPSVPSNPGNPSKPNGSESKPEVDYTKENEKVVANLEIAKTELQNSRELFTPPEKAIIDIVIDVLNDIIGNQAKFKISSETVFMEYTDEILEAVEKYSAFDSSASSSFVSKISQLDTKTFEFLQAFFGFDFSDIEGFLKG